MQFLKLATAAVLISALEIAPALAEAPCCPHPYDKMFHTSFGIGLGYLGAREWHPAAGVLLSVAAGVGKEFTDKKFDTKDALATVAGGLLGVALYMRIGRDEKRGILLIGHNMIGYQLRFD